MACCNTGEPTGMNRRKKGRILQHIRKQMEFYFSDSNIWKDKFLGERLDEAVDGFLDLKLFLTFKKIQALTRDVQDIADALSNSDFLQLSPDGKSVHRVTPVLRTNFDECTIYIEKLPTHASHKWLRDVFSRFGSISYTSLPQFKASGKIKGFAFVEFETPECASKACEAFRANSELDELRSEEEYDDTKNKVTSEKVKTTLHSAKDSSPYKSSRKRKQSESEEVGKCNAGSSMKSGNNEDSPINQLVQICSGKESYDEGHETKDKIMCGKVESCDTVAVKGDKKRKRLDSDRTLKKPKMDQLSLEDNENITSSQTSSHECSINDAKTKLSENGSKQFVQEEASVDEQPTSDNDKDHQLMDDVSDSTLVNPASKSKKRRRRKKKTKTEEEKLNLRVMSKAEWMSYRNKYLSLQRATMSRIKKVLCLDAQPATVFESANNIDKEENADLNYGDDSPIQKAMDDQKNGIEYQPGVIIKITLSEPVSTCVNLKKQVRSLADVCYVDVVEGQSVIFARCNDTTIATSIIKEEKFKNLGSSETLKGEEERIYWEKLQNDRAIRFSSNTRQKKRGRDKIISKAEKLFAKKNTHIRFDE